MGFETGHRGFRREEPRFKFTAALNPKLPQFLLPQLLRDVCVCPGKIVVVLDRPGLKNQGITEKTRVIAVNMPNIVGIADKGYKDYLTTVDELETLTGYNFLSDVPEEIQKVIEAKKDAVFSTQPFGQGE
jgi:hypothetical protein